MAVMDNLPQNIVNQIAFYLNKVDLLSLATCSKSYHTILHNQEFWKR